MRIVLGLALGLALAAGLTAVADFRDEARESGLVHVFPNGGAKSKKYILETTGSGVAVLDYNNDGFADLFFGSGPGATSRLYRNNGKSRFEDVTRALGLEQSGWAQGACAGDYDNDGFTDLFVTYYGQNRLYRNNAGRGFVDVAAKSGLGQTRTRYNTGCAFIDYDSDGDLDLFVANYLRFDQRDAPLPGSNPLCYYRDIPVACGPRGLPFDRNILYRNDGRNANGVVTFTDVSVESGIAGPDQNYALGVVTGDFNHDGYTDLYVACDRTPSLLYINQGNGKFAEEGLLRGVALDEHGAALSGMGVAAGDYDGDGMTDIFRTNFSDERETLYKSAGEGNFEDRTVAAGMAHNTRYVGWGCGFVDFDNDGRKDLLLVNGHVFPEVDRLGIDVTFRQRAILYRNRGGGKLEDVSESAGPGIAARHSSRGAAFADFDNDGSVEVAVNHQNEPPSLLRNRAAGAKTNHWIILKLVGSASNRSAIGARVTVMSRDAGAQVDEVRGGGSYLSQNDLRLHFGLGGEAVVEEIRVEWPSGRKQSVTGVRGDRVVELREPE